MERASNRSVDGYTEKHHIVPKCMGGDNKPRNLVRLTAREHYIAHQLLVKIYPKNRSLVFAAKMMSVDGNGQKRNNKQYGWLKQRHSTVCSARMMGNTYAIGNTNRLGHKQPDSVKLALSIANTGRIKQPEERKNISNRMMGDNNPNKGLFGGEHPTSKRVKISKDGNLIGYFDSITDVCNMFDLDASSVVKVCKGKRKHTKGFVLEYFDNSIIV